MTKKVFSMDYGDYIHLLPEDTIYRFGEDGIFQDITENCEDGEAVFLSRIDAKRFIDYLDREAYLLSFIRHR